MIKSNLLILLCFVALSATAQITDDFSDGNLSDNPTWQGDVDSFTVNTALQLQLNAMSGGSSAIFLPYGAEDSLQWDFWQLLDFSPSAGNNLKTYLNIDNPDPDLASGYFLEIGETGSDDAIKFYKLEQGSKSLLGSASLGAVGMEPALARIRVKRNPGGIWILEADYAGGMTLVEEFEIVNDELAVTGNRYFGFEATYTSTRADKFFFDDIEIQSFVGSSPPSLTEINRITEDSLILVYSKNISSENNQKNDRVSIDQGIGNPTSTRVNTIEKNKLEIKLANPLSGGVTYQICSEGITDNGGNVSISECEEIFLESLPIAGDIVINEILFNPPAGSDDYIEIINTTDKILTLDKLFFANQQNGQSKELEIPRTIAPGEILAFTKDPFTTVDHYDPTSPTQIIENALPSYNVSDGNVWIYREDNGEIITLDSFEYLEDYHFELLDDTKGVSLERLNIAAGSNNPSNWHSASATVNFGTPGYKNSNGINTTNLEDQISSFPNVFSPNGDGDNDFLTIAFNLEEEGFLATIQIYNDRGFPVRSLANNLLLGTSSNVKWDGITNEGTLGDIGIYIILVQLFKPDGQILNYKSSCVLADFLD